MYRKYYILISLFLLLYSLQAWVKHFTIFTGFARNYLADLLALPLILTFGLLVVRKLKQLPFFYLNKKMILFALLYTSILFEYILPKYHIKFTSDYLDIISYTLGAILFYFLQENLKKDEYYKIV